MSRGLLVLFVAVACAFARAGAAQQPAPGSQAVQKCTKCRSIGRIPCPEHEREECDAERLVLYCSIIDGCATCAGIGWLDCASCRDEAVEQDLADRRAEVLRARGRLAHFETTMERELRMLEDENFVVVMELDDLKVGRVRMKAHALAHLYLARMQAVRKQYLESLKALPADFTVKNQVLFWGLLPEHHRAAAKYCEMTGDGSTKLMGSVSNFSVCAARKFFQDDASLHRHVVHNLTHLLLSHQQPSNWIGRLGGGWADEGLAHWMEDRVIGVCGTFCYEEVNTADGTAPGAWRVPWRRLVAKGEAPGLPSMLSLNTDQLSKEQHMAAFSFVDYLMFLDARSEGSGKLNRLLKLLRQRSAGREALATVYGKNPLELQAAWHTWVLETYPASK
jgi:hypothetical protein